MKNLSFFILIFISLVLALASCSDSNPVLTIEGGQVIGVQTPTKGIIAYKGIPFSEDWASLGVILVQVTYRLGIIGFYSHPLLSAESSHGVSGNYGLFDQIAALNWIQNNIEQFGGDPNNITIFGQSAGAGSVQSLCASPLSRNLISHAVSLLMLIYSHAPCRVTIMEPGTPRICGMCSILLSTAGGLSRWATRH